MSQEKTEDLETLVYKAENKEKKSISFTWIVPIIALLILSWVAY